MGRTSRIERARRKTASRHEFDRILAEVRQGRIEFLFVNDDVVMLMGDPDLLTGWSAGSGVAGRALYLRQAQRRPRERLEDARRQAVCDLLGSDVALDAHMRKCLAAELRHLYFPNAERDKYDEERRKLRDVEAARASAEGRGEKLRDADEDIAKAFGWKSSGAMHRWMSRARARN